MAALEPAELELRANIFDGLSMKTQKLSSPQDFVRRGAEGATFFRRGPWLPPLLEA